MSCQLWKGDKPLILASNSQTRLRLLEGALLPVEACASEVDERKLENALQIAGATPAQIALELAKAKAVDISSKFVDRWIIAADQTLAMGDKQFHKPTSSLEAAHNLRTLSGQVHHLNSAVVCFYNGSCRYQHVETAIMTMRILSADFISSYLSLASDSVTRSVGAYQVEGIGIHLFDNIEGDHSTILGLPLLPLLCFFRRLGLVET